MVVATIWLLSLLAVVEEDEEEESMVLLVPTEMSVKWRYCFLLSTTCVAGAQEPSPSPLARPQWSS
jgi:hypothetical protein